MDEQDMMDRITEALDLLDAEEPNGDDEYSVVETFQEAGIMTTNKGLIVRVGGDEFQITVVQSRVGGDDE
jgi:hypothetical protein